MHRLILIFLTCSCFLSAKQTLKTPQEIIYLLNEEEKEQLTEFFDYTFRNCEVGYVLLGKKPVCLDWINNSCEMSLGSFSQWRNVILPIGIQVFDKIKDCFPQEKYAFGFQKNDEQGGKCLYFVNRKELRRVFEENKALFQYVLGPTIQYNDLERSIEGGESADLWNKVSGDNVLLGIVLGFGTENSLYHSRFEKLNVDRNPPIVPPYLRYTPKQSNDRLGTPLKTLIVEDPPSRCCMN